MSTKWAEHNQVKWFGMRPGLDGDQVLVLINTVAAAVIYTVPVGKILLLYNWHIGTGRNNDIAATLRIRNAADAILAIIARIASNSADPGTNATGNLFIPIEIPAGYDIQCDPGAVSCQGYIQGVEVDI